MIPENERSFLNLKELWDEEVVAYFKALIRHSLLGNEKKIHEKLGAVVPAKIRIGNLPIANQKLYAWALAWPL
jgi:hypothetical protein